MENSETAKTVIRFIKESKEEEIIPFMKNKYKKEDLVENLVKVQNQMQKIGGGWPSKGEQITTLNEIKIFTDYATKTALDEGKERYAGILYHNLASFCLPNMDEGVDENFIHIAYESANKDLEIREKLDNRKEILWAKWLVGISEFVIGEVKKSLETLELTIKQAEEDPKDESIIAWSKMMIAKFYFKAKPEKRDLAIELLEEAKQVFEEQEDNYGKSTLEEIIFKFF